MWAGLTVQLFGLLLGQPEGVWKGGQVGPERMQASFTPLGTQLLSPLSFPSACPSPHGVHRKTPSSQVTRLLSNYHSDILRPPRQEFGAMQGEAGTPCSGASGWEDGLHLWVLWDWGWESRQV